MRVRGTQRVKTTFLKNKMSQFWVLSTENKFCKLSESNWEFKKFFSSLKIKFRRYFSIHKYLKDPSTLFVLFQNIVFSRNEK